MKRLIVVLTALAFILGITVVGSAADINEFGGEVTNISGKQVTIKNDAGQLTTITTPSKGFKVGDKVMVKGSTVQSWDPGNKTSQTLAPTSPGTAGNIRMSEEEEEIQTRPAGIAR
jgi:hypothetical protein